MDELILHVSRQSSSSERIHVVGVHASVSQIFEIVFQSTIYIKLYCIIASLFFDLSGRISVYLKNKKNPTDELAV
jgi:hypothetical protein